ncbi:conjugal transfer protein TraO [Burkholderia gladioli]|uniref:KfrB domain-containing protein n=1 Tax=Burkholderia gladioli TaxID=28095 RepID=UPI00285DF4EA|nr:KfrB domain-containing protein [Burkholderia gladioli]MDR8093133.1 conjugal transfer protein TraO [Burkholderia gladioli]
MKERLVVMNGTRVVQLEKAPGQWENGKVDKAGSVKPGVYPIYLAAAPDKSKAYDGPVIHADKQSIFQQTGKAEFVRHARSDFDKVPELGVAKHIAYSQGRAVVTAATASLSRGVKR